MLRFLRFAGTIKNRKFSKTDVASLLKDIWSKKVQSDAEKGSRQDMKEFIYIYFKEKYHDEEMAGEWGYSLNQAFINYENEPHVKLFYDVVREEGSEDIYYREMDVIKTLMMTLNTIDTEAAGILNIDQFSTAIKKAFPQKSDTDIEALVTAAQAELEMVMDATTSIDYRALFTEDEEGHTGPFLTLLKQQERDEREIYVDEIFKQLDGKDVIPCSELKETIQMLDPEINLAQMNKYICAAYKCSVEAISGTEPVELEIIIDRLKRSGAHRVGAVL